MENENDMRLYIDGAQRCLDDARKALRTGNAEAVLERVALVAQYVSLVAHYLPPDTKGVESMRNVWPLAAATTNAIRPLPLELNT